MHGDHEILESSTGKKVFLTRRLALSSDEQARFSSTIKVANTCIRNVLPDYRNRDALRSIVLETTGSKYLGKQRRDAIIREDVANEIVSKSYRVIEKKPKKWGKS